MTQELIVHLARFPDLRLFSIPASFGQSPQADPHELGRKRGPAYVVQASIRSEDSLVHVRAMLTGADDGEVRWNGTYDRPLSPDHIFAAQEEISSEISARAQRGGGAGDAGTEGGDVARVHARSARPIGSTSQRRRSCRAWSRAAQGGLGTTGAGRAELSR
jgi:hypothetical protein